VRIVGVTTMKEVVSAITNKRKGPCCLVLQTDGPAWRDYQAAVADAPKDQWVDYSATMLPGAAVVLEFVSEDERSKFCESTQLQVFCS